MLSTSRQLRAGLISACWLGVVRGVSAIPLSQMVPKLRQTRPEQVNMLPTTASFPHPWLVPSREVEGGYRQLVSSAPPDCSLVLRHAGLLPTYTHSGGQKGQCALNTGASSLTSEPFAKCHLAPERQHQQWLLSSKDHLRPGATVNPM